MVKAPTDKWVGILEKAKCLHLRDRPKFREACWTIMELLLKDHVYLPMTILVRLLSPGWPGQSGTHTEPHAKELWHRMWDRMVRDHVERRLPARGNYTGSRQRWAESRQDRAVKFVFILARKIAVELKGPPGIPGSLQKTISNCLSKKGENWRKTPEYKIQRWLDHQYEGNYRHTESLSKEVNKHSPEGIVGTTWAAPGAVVNALGPPDPCVFPLLEHFSPVESEIGLSLPGSSPGSLALKPTRSPTGSFFENAPGRLPENLVRLLPIEIGYYKKVPDFFRLRVAENKVWQKFGQHDRQSKRSPRILLDLDLAETESMHRWTPDTPHAPVSAARAALCVLTHHVTRLANLLGFHVTIRMRHWTPTCNERTQFASAIMAKASIEKSAESPRTAFRELRRSLPELFSTFDSNQPRHQQRSATSTGPDHDCHLRFLFTSSEPKNRRLPETWKDGSKSGRAYGIRADFDAEVASVQIAPISILSDVRGTPEAIKGHEITTRLLETFRGPFHIGGALADGGDDIELLA